MHWVSINTLSEYQYTEWVSINALSEYQCTEWVSINALSEYQYTEWVSIHWVSINTLSEWVIMHWVSNNALSEWMWRWWWWHQLCLQFITRHGASTSTRWHFAFALCCHSNEIHAPIPNLPNTAQLGGTPCHSAKLHPGPCSSVGMRPRTHTHTHRRAWPQYISRRLRHTRNVITWIVDVVCQTLASCNKIWTHFTCTWPSLSSHS